MPEKDVPNFWKRIPDVLDTLDRPNVPDAINLSVVAKLLRCTPANARRWITKEGPRRRLLDQKKIYKLNGAWMVPVQDFRTMLAHIWEKAGGEERALPSLRHHPQKSQVRVDVPKSPRERELEISQNTQLIPAGLHVTVTGPCLLVRGSSMKSILRQVGLMGKQVLHDVKRLRAYDAQLSGREE